MAATLFNLIVEGCSVYYKGTVPGSFKEKLNYIAGHFSTLEGFKRASIDSLNNIRTDEGDKAFKKLSDKEEAAISVCQKELETNRGIIQNFIKILTQQFVDKQLAKLSETSIDSFNANPILCTALNLKTTEEFIKYNTYQSVGRSIVTSMGYLVQNLLLYSNEYIFDGRDYPEGKVTKWDLVIDRLNDVKTFLEIKSGFNDMDAGQVKHYGDEILEVEKEGNKGYIGITYGKKNDPTVSAGLLKTYVPNWEDKTLVGRELWDFVSEDENYHSILLENIDRVASAVLQNVSIVNKIEERIADLTEEFNNKYDSLDNYYESLW